MARILSVALDVCQSAGKVVAAAIDRQRLTPGPSSLPISALFGAARRAAEEVERQVDVVISDVLQPGPLGLVVQRFSVEERAQADKDLRTAAAAWNVTRKLYRV